MIPTLALAAAVVLPLLGFVASLGYTRGVVSELKGRVDEIDTLTRSYVTKDDLNRLEDRLTKAIRGEK